MWLWVSNLQTVGLTNLSGLTHKHRHHPKCKPGGAQLLGPMPAQTTTHPGLSNFKGRAGCRVPLKDRVINLGFDFTLFFVLHIQYLPKAQPEQALKIAMAKRQLKASAPLTGTKTIYIVYSVIS